MNFFSAAARRLAWVDYEKVSVAMICRDARSTPYTFYRRFPNKQAFLYGLVLVSFREQTKAFNRAMDPDVWKDAGPQAIARRLVDEVIAGTLTVPMIGVTQLAVRIAMSKPKGAESYVEFREAVIKRSIELLSSKLDIDKPDAAIRTAVQMLFAMATDEAWQRGIPVKTGRKRELSEGYSDLVHRCLGLPAARLDTNAAEAIHPVEAQFPEWLQAAYGVTKRNLRAYAKKVNASGKPAFRPDELTDPTNAVIYATRQENRKSEQPFKPKPKTKRKIHLI